MSNDENDYYQYDLELDTTNSYMPNITLPTGYEFFDPKTLDSRPKEMLNPIVKCECGAEVAKVPYHSPWCPKYNKDL